jgi:thioredoxin reductase (NADPH)
VKVDFNTIVIGAGVAGMTASIYLKRSNIEVAILEKTAPGGQINWTNDIENYPGFSHIDGPQLAMNIFNQISELGVEYRYGNVLEIVNKDEYKIIKTDNGELTCHNIIIASGRRPRRIGLSNESELTGRGISYCAICDGPFFKQKKVMVVGGGNSAIEEADYLSEIATEVILVHRSEKFRADELAVQRLMSKTNVRMNLNCVVREAVEKEGKLSSVKLENNQTGEIFEEEVQGLFIYIGHEPETGFLSGSNITLDNDYIVVDSRMATNIKGIYACGDVIKKEVYQIANAAGEGTVAALSLKKDIH